MIHAGIIKSIAGGRAEVVVRRGEENSKCAGCGSCGKTAKEFSVSVEVGKNIHVGDTLKLDLEFPNQGVNALVVFGIPLFCMLFGGFGIHHYWPEDTGFVVGFIGGLFLGFALLYLANIFLRALHIKAKLVD